MRSFEVDGVVYRSIPEFCKKFGLSYQRMIRLCRKYRRAQADPGVAARWMLGLETLDLLREPRTHTVCRDNELAKFRMDVYRVKSKVRKKRAVLDEFKTV